jgi:UPF0271 protein
MRPPELRPLGEGALRLALDGAVDAARLAERLRAWPGVVDVVVAERHAAVYFDPARPPVNEESLARVAVECRPGARVEASRRRHVVRVRYDGPDLEAVARAVGLSPAEVMERHAAREYEVRVIGFLPGFAYLDGLDERLVLPRRREPRPRVPAGAVAIAGRYTSVYPFASPGGWHLLGRALDFTPFRAATGAALALGDRVRFEAA